MTSSTGKGKDFESRVSTVLEELRQRHPALVEVLAQPHLTLNDGGEVIPDFDLKVDLTFERAGYIIECQDRRRSSAQIAHKIRHVKSLSSRNRFIFIYASSIPAATRRVLDADGVVVMSFDEFVAYIGRLDLVLEIQLVAKRDQIAAVFSKLARSRSIDINMLGTPFS